MDSISTNTTIYVPDINIRPWPRPLLRRPRETCIDNYSDNNPERVIIMAEDFDILQHRPKLPDIFDNDYKKRQWQGVAKELELAKEKRRAVSPTSSIDSGISVTPPVRNYNKLRAYPNPFYNHAFEPRLCYIGPEPITPKVPYQMWPTQVSNQGDFNPLTAGPGDVMLNNLAATLAGLYPDYDGQNQ